MRVSGRPTERPNSHRLRDRQSLISQVCSGAYNDADAEIEDDRLRLIFICCHPALPPEGQIALTLREICGLATEEIARAFQITPATLAQRIVRAKAVIRDKVIPYQVPVAQELSARWELFCSLYI